MNWRQVAKAAAQSRAAAIVILMALMCIWPTGLRSQSFYGSIVGTVTDASGAILPGATVTVTNTGTNEVRTMKVDAAGNFTFVNLVPASYKLDVDVEGFKHFVRNPVPVQVGSAARIDAAMEVGAASEVVEVTSQAPLMQTESGQMGQMVEGKTVQEMPLNGRNTMNLVALTAGVIPQGATSGTAGMNQNSGNTSRSGWGNYQIGGSIAGQSATYVDGVAVNVLSNAMAYIPTQDAVQEFNVASNAVSADFGRFGGGVVNMTTKSGTNQWHGSLYEYFRNTVLNGNDWFNKRDQLTAGLKNTPTKFNLNQYGASGNGPIVKDKAFFMFTWEGTNVRNAIASPSYVPTTSMKAGKIPVIKNASGVVTNPFNDPLGLCTPKNSSSWQVDGYFDISNCTFNAAAKQFLDYYPDSNTGSDTYYSRAVVVGNDGFQVNGRVDYTLNANNRLFGRYSLWKLKDVPFNQFPEAKYNLASGGVDNMTNMVVLGETYTINPTTILDVRASWIRQRFNTVLPELNADESKFWGNAGFVSQLKYKLLPTFALNSVRGFWTAWSRGGYNQNYSTNDQISASLVKILGKHTLKVGTELRLMMNAASGTNTAGSFNFNGNYTGDEWGDMLLGYGHDGTVTTAAATTTYNYYQAYYVQDAWHASSKLTLNLGLRYELPGSQAEAHDKATVLLPYTYDPYTGVMGTLGLTKSNLWGQRTIQKTEKRLFAPRVSFAYRIDTNTALRGGYGVAYLPPDLGGGGPSSSTVNSAETKFTNSGVLSPATVANGQFTLMTNPYSSLIQPLGNSAPSFMTQRLWTSAISAANPLNSYPYMQQWNLSLSRQIKGDWLIDAGYAGSKGVHLPALGGGMDELSSIYWADGSLNKTSTVALTTPVGGYTKTVTLGQSRQPYKYYSNFTDAAPRWASSNWHSLQLKTEKRFTTGGILMGSMTWGKLIGDTDSLSSSMEPKASQSTGGGGSGYGMLQDMNNHAAERSILSYNVPVRAVISYVLPLPIGHGKKYFNSLNGLADRLVSGWALNGITTFQSGYALGLNEAKSNNLTASFGAGQLRPERVSGCANAGLNTDPRERLTKWFKTECFVEPGTSTGTTGWALGNSARVNGDIHAAGTHNWDLSVMKSTKLVGHANFEFRGEFFNVFNRTQFGPPFTSRGATTFGKVVSQANKPRLAQFSARVVF